ncbi:MULTISPECIES: TrkH family potassium uptake protein [Halomonas]|uniref:Trk system potassium uptake protein TrkH n=1 Tax=Halomonas ventosae TaxID=229007 RepID=A0A4R6I534_9GAMM|nr:TrkH family potassium uptake protein [Halomonas ventosae]TDO16554.1 trk system potassium uptake protein TrkH [Halomonas ventosae]
MGLRERLRRPVRRAPHGRRLSLNLPELLLLGFFVLSGVGTVLLSLPIAAYQPLTWDQALFTATSAVTVTGLGVIDTPSLTGFGQVVVLALIQVGGLGFMTCAAMMMVMLGIRLPMHQKKLISESLEHTSFQSLVEMVRLVILFALVAEVIGTLLLALAWVPDYGLAKGLWISVFHAISAFNNAGFSTWSGSLTGEVADPLVNAVISLLFIVGGLGFLVIAELVNWRSLERLSLHTRIVLHATFWLVLVAMLSLLLLEWNNPATLGGLEGIGTRLQAAWFQAVTPRTAGFNTLDIGAMSDSTALLTMLWMFIGAGSGSTASGIKVTTMVVLVLVARAFLRGESRAMAFSRSLPDNTVMEAVAVALAGMLLIFTCLLVLTITESGQAFLDLAFESVSAFGTVGLSRGITAELSLPGQLAIIVTMLLGRVGPISLGYLVARRKVTGFRYAEGKVHIG